MKIHASAATAGMTLLLLTAALPAQTAGTVAATASVSKVRIVRLSEVKGAVQLDRSTGRGLEPAITNLPIVEQNRLQTGTGVAEVEFEDNSSLRLAPDSVVEFPELSRTAAGTTVSSVHLLKGMAYITLVKSKGNDFNVLFGNHKVAIPPSAHIRLRVNSNDATLAVFDGVLTVDSPQGPIEVSKKKTATFLMGEGIEPTVAKNVSSDPFDSWDKQATDYHARLAAFGAFGNSPYSYGASDMMYYGAFTDVAGCGSMWRPYFTSASWEPYSAGSWAYYSGAGYSWVSPYPWGWTPYHSGSWSYCPSAGWGWQPGGSWSGLNNGTMIAFNPTNSKNTGKNPIPVAPPHPPRPGEPTLVTVISRPVVRSEMASNNSFVFRKDSAGLGIPRGDLGELNKFSQHAGEKGTASTSVYLSVGGNSASSGMRSASGAIGPVSIHRGAPPPQESASSSYSGSSNSGSYSATSSRTSSVSSVSSAPRSSPAPAPSSGHPR
jgi:hypothetical protein